MNVVWFILAMVLFAVLLIAAYRARVRRWDEIEAAMKRHPAGKDLDK